MTIHPIIDIAPCIWAPNFKFSNGDTYEAFRKKVFQKYGTDYLQEFGRSINVLDITDQEWKILLEIELYDIPKSIEDLDEIYSFDGGLLIVLDNSQILQHPFSSGMISHFRNWQKFINNKPQNWTEIAVGRPWLYGRIKGEVIQITKYWEESMPSPHASNEEAVAFSLNYNFFKEQLAETIDAMQTIKAKIQEILEADHWDQSKALAEKLIENKS